MKQPRFRANRTLVLWLAFVAWCIALFILSSIPGNRIGPMPFFEADKVAHAGVFATGALLLALAFYATMGKSWVKTSILVFLAMVLIGAGDEFHQTFTPGRSGDDPGDLLADAFGATIGIFCAGILHARRPAKTHPRAPGADREA